MLVGYRTNQRPSHDFVFLRLILKCNTKQGVVITASTRISNTILIGPFVFIIAAVRDMFIPKVSVRPWLCAMMAVAPGPSQRSDVYRHGDRRSQGDSMCHRILNSYEPTVTHHVSRGTLLLGSLSGVFGQRVHFHPLQFFN